LKCWGCFSTWLSAVLTYNPMWLFSVINDDTCTDPNTAADKEVSVRHLMYSTGRTFVYNVREAQKADICGMAYNHQMQARFVLASENSSILRRLIYVTSYFLRCSSVMKHGLLDLPRIKAKHLLRTKRVTLKGTSSIAGTENQEENTGPVMFTLGENEKLIHQTSRLEQKKETAIEKEEPLSFIKVSLSK
jgi:hypothetical protein